MTLKLIAIVLPLVAITLTMTIVLWMQAKEPNAQDR